MSSSFPKMLQDDKLRFCRVLKGTKKPFEKEWTKKPYTWEQIVKFRTDNGENYGILCGHGNLNVIDVDNPAFVNSIEAMFPETFTVETGSGGKHYYFFIPDLKQKLILESGTLHLGEVQSWGSMVVGPNSIHPNGKEYKIVRDVPIATIGLDYLYERIYPFIKHIQQAKEVSDEMKKDFPSIYFENEPDVMDIWTPDEAKQRGGEYFGSHPIHGSEGGQNFWVSRTKGLWHCFRHSTGGDWWSAIAVKEGLIDCSEAERGKIRGELARKVLEIAKEKYGLKIKPNTEFVNKVYERIEEKRKERLAEAEGANLQKLEQPEQKPPATQTQSVVEKESSEPQQALVPETCEVVDEYEEVRNEVYTALLTRDRRLATELMVREVLNKKKIYTIKEDTKTEMWIYDDGVYVPNGKSEVKRIVRCILKEAFTTHLSSEVIAKIEADTFVDADDFFNVNYVDEVPVMNGILNLRTREMKPFNSEQIFFNKIPVYYDPKATCPAIQKHFEEVLKNKEDANVLYEIIGFLLWKEYFIEKAIIFSGNGRNGKGKTIDLIKRFIGGENCASVPLASIREDSFSLSNLFGKMVNLAGDISNTALKETGQFKESTGRDLLNAKRKFLTDLQFVNHAKHIFACNELPLVYDNSRGFWDRWVLFEFNCTFVGKTEYESYTEEEREKQRIRLLDPNHIEKISTQEELNGLLNKALDGLDTIRKNKEFSYSVGVDEVKRYWVRKANSFLAFCLDNVEDGEETDFIPKPRLRKCYKDYCKEHGIRPSSDKVVHNVMTNEYGATEEEYRSEILRERRWFGVKFKATSKYSPSIS
jgi:putative DNA primase/helicase